MRADDPCAGPLRFGVVEAVGTPPAVPTPPRFSEHLTFMQHPHAVHPPADEPEDDSPPTAHARVGSGTSGSLSPWSPGAALARQSYMTTDSHMSSLSAFPAPPTTTRVPPDLTPAHMSILHSYFGGGTPTPAAAERDDPLARAGRLAPSPAPPPPPPPPPAPAQKEERAVRRTTFGQDDFGSDDGF